VNTPIVHRRVAATGVLALYVLAFAGCSKEEQAVPAPPEVQVAEVVQKDVPIYREWVGQTTGAVDIEIRARVNGWLTGIHFREGSEVKKGTLLYTIDDNELKQAMAEAKAKLAQARTLYVRAQSDVARYQPLAAAGAVSQRDLDNAVAEEGARKSEVDAAAAAVQIAEINLSYASVRAPVDGLIGISAARVGDFVGRPPNPVILNTISRIDSIHVRFSISEQEYMELARRFDQQGSDTARRRRAGFNMVLADGSVYPLRGSLVFIQRQVDAATGTLQLEASFPNPQRMIRPGQFARIQAMFDQRKDALLIPAKAVTELQGQYFVFVVGPEDKAQFRKVELGPKTGSLQVVEKGVTVGERVIVEGIQKVRPDAVVTPATVSAPADTGTAQGPKGGGE
jgi:membrane fusion protein (multidrug efflux system)